MQLRLIQKLLFYLVVIPGIPFIVGSAGLLVYSFWPGDYTEFNSRQYELQEEHLVLLAHGLKDSPKTWANELAEVFNNHYQHQSARVMALDWSQYAQSTLRCSVNAVRIGEALAQSFVRNPALKSLHLIGHSCGSFILYSLCQNLKKHNKTLLIQTTYLDPVSVYGGLWWDYGLDYFGRCADFSEAYIDTEDGIPGSDQALANAYTFDVTSARQQIDFDQTPHLWPPVYYLQRLKNDGVLLLQENAGLAQQYPRGKSELRP